MFKVNYQIKIGQKRWEYRNFSIIDNLNELTTIIYEENYFYYKYI
jgi:hypothetical protein